MINKISAEVFALAQYLKEYGARTYLVGGMPRDFLLNQKQKKLDYDLEIYGIEFADLIKLIIAKNYRYKIQGNFGVIKLIDYNIELAIPRNENKIGIKHADFEVNLNPHMELAEAIKRRDFTINTIMYDLNTRKFIISDRAQFDLEYRQLRAVSEKFSEDPLRILRAIRFACVLDLEIESQTLDLCVELAPELTYISSDRIRQEFKQILKSKHLNKHADYLNLYFHYYLKLKCLDPSIEFTSNLIINAYILSKHYSLDIVKELISKTELKYINYLYKLEKINYGSASDIYDLLPMNEIEKKLLVIFLQYHGIELKQISAVMKLINDLTELKRVYNGNYFIGLGISGKQIVSIQKSYILGEIDYKV